MSKHTCLKSTHESISMTYFDLPTLNSNTPTKPLYMRRLIITGTDLMKITHGCYVLFHYIDKFMERILDKEHHPKDIKSLRFQFNCHTNIYSHAKYNDHYIVVAKFTDSNFTQLTDITLDDIILFAPKKQLTTELAEQLAIYKAL